MSRWSKVAKSRRYLHGYQYVKTLQESATMSDFKLNGAEKKGHEIN